ncbi:MAG: S8 family serine peptidase [Ferruginibacter sp.]
MHLKNILIYCAVPALFLISCKKQDQAPVAGPGPVTCKESAAPANGDIISGRYIVAYNQTINARGLSASRLEETGETVLERNNIPADRLQKAFGGTPGGFIVDLSPEQVTNLRSDASVAIIEPDRVISLAVCFTVAEPRLLTWNIQRVGYGDGTGKTAWIIDTGIDFDHPDLTVDIAKSRSFLSGVSSADDENGHGTHVAGIIGGKNNTIGVLGVASGATLVSLRVLNAEGTGTLSSVIQALSYVNEQAKAGDVVNLSLGEEESSAILIQQVQHTASRGIYLAIAAGNEHDLANKTSPANANGPNIYTVSAVDSLDRFASFSNYGNDVVDYAAPGVRILSTFSEGRYAYLSGTSMAAPHMAGLLLLKGSAISTSGYAVNDPDGVPDPIAHK